MSSKNKLIYILIGLILLLISIKAGLAVEEDFRAYSANEELNICGCSSGQNTIVVENTGSVTSTYEVSQNGDATKYTSSSNSIFSLKPGEKEEVTSFFSPACDAQGIDQLTTTIKTVFETEKVLTQNINVQTCDNIEIVQVEQPASSCPCEPVRIDFTLTNSGEFVETYFLSASPLGEFVEISENVVVLGPKDSIELYAFVRPSCGYFGNLGFVLHVEAEKNKLSEDIPFSLIIDSCYDYAIVAEDNYNLCQDTANILPVKIQNTADIANTYFLSTDTNWAQFENPVLSLKKGEEGTSTIVLEPLGVKAGQYEVALKSISERGGLKAEKSMQLNVESCYSLAMLAEDVPNLVSCESYNATAVILNDGTLENKYSINVVGPEWVSYNNANRTITEQKTDNLVLTIDAPCDSTKIGKYEIDITAYMTEFPEKTAEAEIEFEVVSVEDAYSVEFSTEESEIKTGFEPNTIPFIIENTGIRQGNYALVIIVDSENNNWVALNENRISVAPGKQKEITLTLNPIFNNTPEGTYTITVGAALEGFETESGSIVYTKDIKVKLQEKSFFEKITYFFKIYWLYLIIALAAILAIILLIAGLVALSRKREEDALFAEEPVEIVKEVKEIKDEEPLLEIEKEKTWPRKLIGFFLILFILAAIAGIGYALYTFALPAVGPFVTDVFNGSESNETINDTLTTVPIPIINNTPIIQPEAPVVDPFENSTIFVNRTGLAGSGNIVEIKHGQNITIPITIQNKDAEDTYNIRIAEDVEWIATSRSSLSIPPGAQGHVDLVVTPGEEVEQGDYSIIINIDVRDKQPISEEIVLRIQQKPPFWEKYFWYLVAGLGILVILLLIGVIKRWVDKREKQKEFAPFIEEKPKKEEKSELFDDEEFGEGKGTKRWVVGIILLLLLIGAIAAGVYFAPKAYGAVKEKFVTDSENITGAPEEDTAPEEKVTEVEPVEMDKEEKSPAITPLQNQTEELSEEEYTALFIKKQKQTIIPLKITNTNNTNIFKIDVEGGNSWIYVNESIIKIDPLETKTVNLIVAPDENVADGDYKVGIEIEGQRVTFSKSFILEVRKNKYSDSLSYLMYILAGLIVLASIIAYLQSREKDDDGSVVEELSEEEKPEKKTKKTKKNKTNIKLE